MRHTGVVICPVPPHCGGGAIINYSMGTNKKLLIVSQHFWPETFRVNDLCDFLQDKNCEIEVLCGIPNYPKGKFFDNYSFFKNRKQYHKGVKVHRALEIPRGNNSNLRIFLNYISFSLFSLFHIPRLLMKRFDKIFIFQTSPVIMATAGILIGRLKQIEATMYVLDLWPENLFSVLNIKNPILQKLAKSVSHWHYKHADKLIVLSEKMKTRLVDVTSIAPGKIIVIPQVCEKIYETDVHDEKLAARFNDSFNILFAGSITPAQSFETIITAAKKLNGEGISNIKWIIVGDGMSRQWLEDEVNKNDLTHSFAFEGLRPIEDIPKYNDVADVLVGCLAKSNLLEATIPAKVMSYIASGKPIVLAMDGEIQPLINKTIKCGYVGDAGDAEAFASNIKRIYTLSSAERVKMGKRARNYHFKHFERNLILNKLYSFIFD
jgi:colanic acid biosynthesis glycosyl transferase WcaI